MQYLNSPAGKMWFCIYLVLITLHAAVWCLSMALYSPLEVIIYFPAIHRGCDVVGQAFLPNKVEVIQRYSTGLVHLYGSPVIAQYKTLPCA